jgi:hypothetical protein
MEAHAGTISIGTRVTVKPKTRRLKMFSSRVRARRRERLIRHHAAGSNRTLPGSIPGSEHTHLILPPKAY